MTTCLKRPMLSPSKQIPIQLFRYKTTTCLMRQATTFFVLQMKKKNCLKQPPQNKEIENKHKATMFKK